MASLPADGLARLFLARLPPAERPAAVNAVVADLCARSAAAAVDFPTVFLAADLLKQCPEGPDKDATAARLDAVTLQLVASSAPGEVPTELIRLCARHEALAIRIFDELTARLARTAAALRNEGRLAVASSAIPWKHHPSTAREPRITDAQLVEDVVYLDFFKFFFCSDAPCTISVTLLHAMLALLAASSDKVALASRTALSAAFYSIHTGKVVLDRFYDGGCGVFDQLDMPLGHLIWNRIKDLLAAPPQPILSATAFTIWFRWFVLQGDLGPSRSILAEDNYWDFLQLGLRDGFSEQRKFCLHILRASVRFAQTEQDEIHPYIAGSKQPSFEADYTRYCTLFETIILGRYLNQVEECMPDLQNLAWNSTVHSTWIVTLLRACLRSGVQDGIRKLIGNRILQGLVPMPNSATEAFQAFVSSSFLPWATQGVYFTSTLRRSGQHVRCEHGEALSSFIQRLLQKCPEHASRQAYARAVLSYIDEKGQNFFQHALPYCLQGILDGFGHADGTRSNLLTQDIPLLIQVVTRSGLPEVARDFSTAVGSILIDEASKTHPEILAHMPGYGLLEKRWAELRNQGDTVANGPKDQSLTDDEQPSLKAFLTTLRGTKYRSLQGSGLLAACSYVGRAIVEESELDAKDLYDSLEAIWDEMETQEYPRPALMQLPEILFHPRCLRMASEDTQALLSRALSEFQVFTEGRIYVLPPLAKALRKAYLQAPEVVDMVPLEEFLVRFTNRPPTPKLEFLLEAAVAAKLAALVPHRSYGSYYGPTEARGYAYLFDLLNRIRTSEHDFARRVFDRVMHPWITQKMPIPIVSKWKVTTQVQTMLLLSRRCLDAATNEEITDYLQRFTEVLSIEPLPRYRFLLEWIIARIYVRKPEQRSGLLKTLAADDHSNPKHLASVMKMAVMVARLPDSDRGFSYQLMTLLIPLSASSKIVIRHEAQWSFPPLWDHAESNGWAEITGNTAFAALNRHIRALDKYSTPPPERTLEWLDPINDHSLAMLFGGRYLDMHPAEARVVSVEDFQAVWAEDEAEACARDYSPPQVPLGEPKARVVAAGGPADEASPEAGVPAGANDAVVPLQTKGNAWQEALLAPPAASSTGPRTQLILIASLIDNAYNLGGLSRAAEIFGCSAMYMRTLDTLSHRDFTSVSVSSHSHLPIHALPPADLAGFLRAKKVEGYTVLGVEQTDRSKVLGAEGSQLPEKCVLVMGSEREGIPGTVLAECDMCVEVRQLGVTRSLNVQTAAAIVLYEYQRQHYGREREGRCEKND